ncbi:hypothetical protein [Sediminicoccus sp. KRV36]|uniref:hypothetical protein n=1 Tax=Sediminicoccus sp. KRV36 TaxID=3133721 RepID=UPI00201012D3|nr:hypothetical protein [Sediminicoccus rosea]UPY36022.1 hypothetical protein LHU95_17630 [Sediminicoccus rosea]
MVASQAILPPSPELIFGFHDADGWMSRYACFRCRPGCTLKAKLLHPCEDFGTSNTLYITINNKLFTKTFVLANEWTDLEVRLPSNERNEALLIHLHSEIFRAEDPPGVRLLGLVVSDLRLEAEGAA